MRISFKLSVAAMIGLFLIGTAYAMIRTLPIEELVRKSDHIVIAYVYSVTAESSNPSARIVSLRNELKVIESLKGSWPSQKPIILTTIGGDPDYLREDNVDLPAPGTKVLLFLKMVEGRPIPVNSIQGVCPMRKENPMQMCRGTTLDQIRAIVKSQEGMEKG